MKINKVANTSSVSKMKRFIHILFLYLHSLGHAFEVVKTSNQKSCFLISKFNGKGSWLELLPFIKAGVEFS